MYRYDADTNCDKDPDQIPRDALQHFAAVDVPAHSKKFHVKTPGAETVLGAKFVESCALSVSYGARDEILQQGNLEMIVVEWRRASNC